MTGWMVDEGWFSMLPRSLIIENHGGLHPESCDGCSFCTGLQSGADCRQQMQHVPHFTRNASDGQEKKKVCANPHRHAVPQSHVLNVLHLQSANRRREIWSSQHWQAHNPTLGCKSIRFDSVLFTAEETWNEKWTQWWILILVHLVFSSFHLTMPQTITLTLLHQCFTLITLFKTNCQEILIGFLSTIYKLSFFHFY